MKTLKEKILNVINESVAVIFYAGEPEVLSDKIVKIIDADRRKEDSIMGNSFLITATIERKRRYFIVPAKEDWEAIKLFNEIKPGVQFKSIKLLEHI